MILILQKYSSLAKVLGLQPYSEKYPFNQLTAIGYMLSALCMVMMSLGNFILHIYGKNVRKTAESATGILGFLLSIAQCAHMLINRHKFQSLQMEMNKIVNERIQFNEGSLLYAKIERRFTFYVTIAMRVIGLISCVALSPFVLAAYHLCMGTYTAQSWVYFFAFWLPFELDTIVRHFTMGIIQWYAILYALFLHCAILSFFSGIILYAGAFLIDIKSIYNRMDKLSESKRKGSHLAMLEYCKGATDLHVRLMSCMRNLGDVMNWIILTTITPCVMTLCAAFFLLDLEDDVVKYSEIQMPIVAVTSMLETLFAYSFFGQILHTKLIDLNDAIYQSKWYQYPPGAQRIVLMMTMHVQKPFYIGAYGLLHCKLENFVGVFKSVYSSLMVLRRVQQN